MTKSKRWVAIIGVVCGAELAAVAVIGGAGLAAFVSLEAALAAAMMGGLAIWAVVSRRRSVPTPERPAGPGHRDDELETELSSS